LFFQFADKVADFGAETFAAFQPHHIQRTAHLVEVGL
jgi:hypothetical protein